MGNAVVHVMKGCRSAEFQWHVATIAGKHMLLLVVHLVLRRVVEMHSLRLKRRIAACHVPCDAVLLRPDIASSGRTVLLSSANGTIHRLEVTFNGEVLHQKHAVTVADKAPDPSGASHVSDNDEAGKLFTFRRVGERGNRASPYDALMEVIRLPLPTPADDETAFEEYCARFSAVRQNIRTMFSPGALSNNAFPTPVVATGVDVPICSTAAQCLAFIELRQTCISNYHRALHLRWDGNSPMCSVRTAETTCNDEPVFLAGGQPHQTLPPIFDRMAKKLSDDRDVVLSAIIADLLPSIGRFIQSCHSSAPANGPIDCQITAVPLNIFLEFFSIDGFRLEFQPTLVQRYEEKCDVLRDLWSELGTVFLGGGRGVVCLQQQLEICSSLGFRTMHIVAMTVSWLCRSFVQTRTWVSLGSLSDIVFLLKLTDDEAFLAAMELMPCLVVSPMWSVECCEAHLLLLAFFVVLRNNTKPFSSSHRGRFLRLLRQLLGLRASISRVESLLVKEKKSLLSSIRVGGRLRLGSLFPCNDSDTLCASFFKFYSHNAAYHLASNTPWGEEVKEMLAPVDLIYWLSIIFRMNGDCGHSGEVAWCRDGQWDYEGFVSRVVEPLLSEFETIGQRCIAETANSSHLTSKRLVPLSALMVVALIMLEDTLAPLRDTTLAFWEEGSVPDSNLFEAGRGHTSRVLGRPSGSRSTRDYFKSCSALARVCLELAEQLMDNGDQQSCGKTVESIIHFLSVDEASVFPLVPIVVRLGFDDLVASLRTCPLESLERIREAYHFVQTVSLFAFRDGAVGVNMMPPSLPHISWATMYMKPDSLLTFCCSRNSRKEEFRICDSEERLMMRSVFMRDLAFALLTNGLSVVDVDFMGKLSNSMGLSRNVTDLHLLVLLHVESALLQPETEIGGLVHDITNRHLAAFIAVFNLKLILASCFRYYADLKAAIPSDRRHEKQQTVLRLQSMSATMSDKFRTWLHSNATDCSNVLVPDACEAGAGTALAFDYRLVAHLCAHGPDHVRRVEERVRECFQSSESTAKLQNMRAVALTLARIAKEGASLLPAESLCGVANELPAVVARLADLI
ncbi:hypothetical protein TRVL_05494 [Trypanosoma vivax]|nr:hypothetical protein TRVL_05494 [Trypanosoma vivax]